MSLTSTFIRKLRTTAVFILLPLLACSCQWITDDYEDETADNNATRYINITISVSAGNNSITRANPNGGEYGDGPETGSERENLVNNITLIFYQDNAGINTTSDQAEVLCVKQYSVHPFTYNDLPNSHTHKTGEPSTVQANEVLYSTGSQKLEETSLVAGETYKVIVVANANPNVVVGEKIKDVRDKVLSTVYTVTDVGTTNFVMTSESDATISLTNPTVYTSMTITEKNRYVYYFDCIHIERLAARLDFWANNSNGYKTSSEDSRYENTPGYEYSIYKPGTTEDTGDRFVLTSITPFNLNNGDEYLLKRVTTGFGENSTTTWLGNETLSNYVLDPHTTAKTSTTEHPTYFASTLTSVISDFNNSYTITMASQHPAAPQASPILNVEGKDNIILCYPKENTLQPGVTSLYYYATGLAFEGYYYQSGKTTGERRVYYYFIRHQGEQNTAYDVWTPNNIEDAKTTLCPSTPAMNFGIVRNNIYRISVNKVAFEAGTLELNIAVHDWRNVQHPDIFI